MIKRLLAAFVGALVAAFVFVAPASAASLQEITGFGTNPTNLRMHLYVPDRLPTAPALLVAVHYCTGTGPAFYSGTEFASLADQYGFIVIYPSATRSGQCFDVSTQGALKHDGNSDPVGIVSMVRYVQQRYGTDAARTFVTGASSGGMMTNVLLGDYPDVFAAGAAYMGVPFGCFATTDGSLWNTACANGQVSKTPQAWGDLVRAAYPGYSGRRPRMQLVHGTTDTTLQYPNFGEAIKQWTNVLGVSQTPAMTDSPQSGWTRTRYGSTSAQAPVEGISVAGVGHSLPLSGMARLAITFFGLDSTTPPTTPPPTTPPPTTPPPTTPPPTAGACRVTVAVNAWNTGLTDQLTIVNTGAAAINGWSLGFALPAGQTITSGWNATYSPASGQVTARNASYNGTLAPGASTTIGFQATHTGNSAAPSGFTLNGTACSST
ncbi:extracellular catalytic domain type 1 short-chain-length polyhydroxyalkanoate depolymerase [Paractinoplanes atraurantiacus]|uniref:Esterase, PHB depolymerase family n=1 Tax=Paractinoplanes atraurantiacus TaxID=1036182 RepID=A0A285IKQ4_9ACTN|nr:PHB depolymerase family esterase [Actinoplanes atraurantiacus]SNY48555.1 esterase, PHB depolymerase family [Actinoplanes atraurantiacus]